MVATLFQPNLRCRSGCLFVTAVAVLGIVGQDAAAREPYPKINLSVGYRVDPDWPEKPEGITWRYMASIAVDAEDRVWTLNNIAPQVQVYSPEGKMIRSWGEGQLQYPHHIHIDREGHVWIADISLHVVRKFTPEGKVLLTLGTPGEAGKDETHLNRPASTATTPSGDVFVADGYGNDRILHFDARGKFIKEWGKLGVGKGELSLPHSLALDSKGRLYVGERNNCRVQVFDQEGKSLAEWRHLINPWGIWISPKDEVYVCGSSPVHWGEGTNLGGVPHDQMVIKFDTTGRALELWTFPLPEGDEPRVGVVDWVHGIAVDSKGNLFLGGVSDEGKTHRVHKFVRIAPER